MKCDFRAKNVLKGKRKPSVSPHHIGRSFHRQIQICEVHRESFARITPEGATPGQHSKLHISKGHRGIYLYHKCAIGKFLRKTSDIFKSIILFRSENSCVQLNNLIHNGIDITHLHVYMHTHIALYIYTYMYTRIHINRAPNHASTTNVRK